MQTRLNAEDVERLLLDKTEEVRGQTALRVAEQFRDVVLTPRERELAEEILGYLVHDVALHVRVALSNCLHDLPDAPHKVILDLARDIDEVALPILERSTVLTDEDLVEIVLSGGPAKQCAIARRPEVGAQVSETIAWAGDRKAVLSLVANEGAMIGTDAFQQIVDLYASDEDVLDPMASRKDLPASLVERLVTMVSDRLRVYLIDRHQVDPATAALLDELARERAIVDLAARTGPVDLPRLARQLFERRRLGPSLLLRALSAGEIRLVELCFGFLTDVPDERIVRLVHDIGPLGFRALYTRAGLPEVFYPAFRAALDVVHERQADGYLSDKPFLRHCVLERVAPLYRDIEADEIDLVIDRLARRARSLPWHTGHAA